MAGPVRPELVCPSDDTGARAAVRTRAWLPATSAERRTAVLATATADALLARDVAILRLAAEPLPGSTNARVRTTLPADGRVVDSARSAVIVRCTDIVVECAAATIDRAAAVIPDKPAEWLSLCREAGCLPGLWTAAGAHAFRDDACISLRTVCIVTADASEARIAATHFSCRAWRAALPLPAHGASPAGPAIDGTPTDGIRQRAALKAARVTAFLGVAQAAESLEADTALAGRIATTLRRANADIVRTTLLTVAARTAGDEIATLIERLSAVLVGAGKL